MNFFCYQSSSNFKNKGHEKKEKEKKFVHKSFV